jgi:hypothetical protein
MLNRPANANLRRTLLAAAAFATLLVGTEMAAAQPGAAFQNNGIRDLNGLPPARGTYRSYYYAGDYALGRRYVAPSGRARYQRSRAQSRR